MDNMVKEERAFPIFRILYKNLIFIILLTILCGLLGAGYGIMKDKTVYKASCSAVFRASISGSQSAASDASNTVSLGKIYIPMVEDAIKSPAFMERANEELKEKEGFENETVSTGAITLSFKEESLIFSISYSDFNESSAREKLQTVVDVAKIMLADYLPARDVSIIATSRHINVTSSRNFAKYVTIAVVIGVAIGVVLSVLRYTLDSAVRDKGEIEEMTGVSVIASIEKYDKK